MNDQSINEIKNEINEDRTNKDINISLINQEITTINNNFQELNNKFKSNSNIFESFKAEIITKVDILKTEMVRKQSATNLSVEKINKLLTNLINNVKSDFNDIKNQTTNMIQNAKIESNSN